MANSDPRVAEYLDFEPKEDMGGADVSSEPKAKPLPSGRKFGQAWLSKIKAATDKQREWSQEGEDYYKLYRQDKQAWKSYSKLADYPLVTISTNPIALNVDNDSDRILPKDPEFKVSPKTQWLYSKDETGQIITRNNVKAARMYQQVANILALELGLRKTAKRAAKDSLVTNLGVIKVGWDEMTDISHSTSRAEGEKGESVGLDDDGELPPHELVKPKFPWVTYVPWNRILIDPLAGNMEQVTWWAELIIEPKGGKEDEDELNEVDNVAIGDDDDDMGGMSVRDTKVASTVRLRKKWEVHYVRSDSTDPSGKCFYRFNLASDGKVTNHKKFEFNMGGFVYTPLQFKDINGDPLGYSQIRLYAETAANTNLMKQLAMDYAIRGIPFMVAASGTDDKTIKAASKGRIAKIVKGSTPNAKDTFWPVAFPPLNQELFAVAGVSANAEQMMSGRSLNDKLQGGDQTATEAKIISTNSGEILRAAVDTLREFMATVMKKAMRVYAHLMDDDETYEIPDPHAEGEFLQHEKKDLICDITMELSWQSSVQEDDAVSRKLNMDLLSILINVKAIMPEIDLTPVIEKIVVASGYDDPTMVIKEAGDKAMMLVLEYVGGILAGDQIQIDPNTDWAAKFKQLTQFAALVMKDPELKRLFETVPGAMQRLMDAAGQAARNAQATGGAIAAGIKPSSGGGGSGAQNNRVSQSSSPNQGDMQASMTREVSNMGGTGAGRMKGM